jgi:hypothetical protein
MIVQANTRTVKKAPYAKVLHPDVELGVQQIDAQLRSGPPDPECNARLRCMIDWWSHKIDLCDFCGEKQQTSLRHGLKPEIRKELILHPYMMMCLRCLAVEYRKTYKKKLSRDDFDDSFVNNDIEQRLKFYARFKVDDVILGDELVMLEESMFKSLDAGLVDRLNGT